MSGHLNKATLIGNLGRDPEVRTLNDGSPVVNLAVATSETWRDKNTGDRRERTEWHRVVIFNEHLVKVAQNYLKKGSKVYIEGQIQTRKWQGQDGQDKYTTEIVLQRFRGELQMLDSKSGGSSGAHSYAEASGGQAAQGPDPDDLDDEIPFLTNGGIR